MKDLYMINPKLLSIFLFTLLPFQVNALGAGKSLPGTEPFDNAITEFIAKWDVPGASLAVAKDGKLLLAKGYGISNKDNNTPVSDNTLFRMGSINKTLTAVVVMQLVELGKVKLDDKAISYFTKLGIQPDIIEDSRIQDITVRQLLQHTAGFDRNISGDHFFQPRLRVVAQRQRAEPVTCQAIIKDALETKLDFTPGERFAYSNTGYCMLGKIIEAASGKAFTEYASNNVLQPVIGKAFLSGKSLTSMPEETQYFMYPGEANLRGAPGVNRWSVPTPYGSYSIENMDALGAWVATPSDVLKFFLAIDGSRGPRLLQPFTFDTMTAPPSFAAQRNSNKYFGMGVEVIKDERQFNWFHRGSQPGVETLALRTSAGYSWVVAFNTRPHPDKRAAFFREFDRALWNAARNIKQWPLGDLFN
jgi:N-acyl-D-amino-acid deacylase